MKPVFHHRLINSPFEDPCLHVRILRERRSLLFDLGDISVLSPAQINRITDVFVTHTHIDHFIGFDLLLRTTLRRAVPLNVYGPAGILPCVEGKLRGYAWNLIGQYPTRINVFSFDGAEITQTVFRAEQRFIAEQAGSRPSDGLLVQDLLFRVEAAVLDHGIPCLAFSLEEDYHINIDKDRLARRGLPVGPWLTLYKRMLREKASGDETISVEGNACPLRELSDISTVTKGQKISFVTDIAMSEKNLARVAGLVRDSDVLYCEAYFLEKDRDRAVERHHLTARACGYLARSAGVKNLEVMHFSPKYSDCPEQVIQEAMAAFRSEE